MALQGNLRDFSAMEILQLVGSQKKSGCLVMEWNTERFQVWVTDGRIVSTRQPGLTKDDALAAFLRKVHRLSDEQFRGLVTIQKESGRDLEDLLVKGRYLEAGELASLLERQILNDLMRLVRWENGSYRFDPVNRWPGESLVMLSMEGVMIEAARRFDEQKRFVAVFKDPYQLLGVRDLPDPDETLSDEEREIFGIVDGQHTVAEVVQAAPLVEYEAYEALHRMMESQWIEFVGRRDPGIASATPAAAAPARDARHTPVWTRELAVAAGVLAIVALVRLAAAHVPAGRPLDPESDVYAIAQTRDLREAVELFARERGEYPHRLEDMVEDRWLQPAQLKVPGYTVHYRVVDGGRDFELGLSPDR
ncbi:MAG TPA: DUF4388 domain-containing protein [Candidatus Eisenbacteria bacterium]|jgi:hypothetical protein